ncbi:MAG TPA: ferrous iron transporter B [Planctomycetota bacterium]
MTTAAVDTLRVAVAGNPNTGKSSLFNALTGARQHVGNYPGVTVERRQGRRGDLTLVDLPGTYSLTASSPDEKVVVDVLLGRHPGEPKPDAVLCVVDANNLRRNLYLVSQIAETGLPIVIALNMIDEAEAKGVKIDVPLLRQRLGVPVVATVAPTGVGIGELGDALRAASGGFPPVAWPAGVKGPAFEHFQNADGEAAVRYAHLEALTKGVVTAGDPARARDGFAADRLLTHRVFGLAIFLAIMFAMFSSIYWVADPLMKGVDAAFGWMGTKAAAALEGRPMLQSLVETGIIGGVGGVVIFLPQILILFMFIAILEDSGYMSRAAFLMDRVFGWTGLNGKSFVPMLSSFACAIPGVMATRTIEDPRARLTTILIAPLMSCSARLPVYVILIGAFVRPAYGPFWAGAALFGMHLVGLVVGLPLAALMNRFFLKVKAIPFILEMPPYRRPRAGAVLRRMWFSGKEFTVRAGTVILAFAIVIWALTYFPGPAGGDEATRLEDSYLGRAGKTVQPAFAPAGFDWKLTIGVLAAFPARELIVPTLGILYAVDEEDEKRLQEKMAAAYTGPIAAAVMVFIAFCLQCGSTVAVMAREAGWRWAGFAFAYMTALAWVGAVATYQIGRAVWTL